MPDQQQPQQTLERAFIYAFQQSVTANASLPDQSVTIQGDADFVIKAIAGSSTSTYTVRLRDGYGYYLSSAQIKNTNLIGSAAFPVPVFPELVIPAGGKIGIDLTETSGSTNAVEIIFIGTKRYKA